MIVSFYASRRLHCHHFSLPLCQPPVARAASTPTQELFPTQYKGSFRCCKVIPLCPGTPSGTFFPSDNPPEMLPLPSRQSQAASSLFPSLPAGGNNPPSSPAYSAAYRQTDFYVDYFFGPFPTLFDPYIPSVFSRCCAGQSAHCH